MSYRPDDQALEPSIEKLLECISEFRNATLCRLEDTGEWSQDHLKEINDLSIDLIRFESSLFKLKGETW